MKLSESLLGMLASSIQIETLFFECELQLSNSHTPNNGANAENKKGA